MFDHLQMLIAAGLLLAFGTGAVTYALVTRRLARQRRRPPKEWPLTTRAIINSEERRVWRWLELAFVDYSVMVKMPVTRFSMPHSKKQGLYWFELLSSLYCTFTVVRADGQVMGCVDLYSESGNKIRSRSMKAILLEQCGIAYLVLHKGMQPSIAQIRFEFLGEASRMPQTAQQTVALDAASSVLRDAISRKRHARQTSDKDATNEKPARPVFQSDSDFAGLPSSGFKTQWVDDSFIMPLDSRRAPLNK